MKGFYFEDFTLNQDINMSEHIKVDESIYEGVV